MTNHVHLLLTPKKAEAVPRLIMSLGRRYVQYFNRTRGRTGTLWDGPGWRANPRSGRYQDRGRWSCETNHPGTFIRCGIRAIIFSVGPYLIIFNSDARLVAT